MYVDRSSSAADQSAGSDPGIGHGLTEALLRTFAAMPFVPHKQSRGERRAVRMVPYHLDVNGRRLCYSVSDNRNAVGPEGPGSEPIWAVNIHGYFAGGTMYWRESANLAERLGWRVINPCLPGFAGSDPLPWQNVTIADIANQVLLVMDELGVERAVMLGHSMGGAVAVQMADSHPERVLGVIYRDGAATPEWKQRHGVVIKLLSPLLPGVANLVDLTLAVVLDSPDFLVGRRLSSTVRGLWPDAQQNFRTIGRILPVGSMLMALDMSDAVGRLASLGIPVLAEWGCFDRVVTARTAQEFQDLTGCPVVWVFGGHSWMLPRPQGQSDILRHIKDGRDFVTQVVARRTETGETFSGDNSPLAKISVLRTNTAS
jgi:pimeloyl-ACP methyl ester carboxylesterase